MILHAIKVLTKKESLMKIKAVTDQEALEQYEEAATQQPEEGFIPEVISAAPESLFFSSFRYDFATGSVLVDEGEDVITPIHIALNVHIAEVEEEESMMDNSKVSFVDATYMEVPYLDGDGSTFQTIVLKFKKMGKPGQYIGRDGYIVDAFNNG